MTDCFSVNESWHDSGNWANISLIMHFEEKWGKVEERFTILESLGIVLWPQKPAYRKNKVSGTEENFAVSPTIAAVVDAEVIL